MERVEVLNNEDRERRLAVDVECSGWTIGRLREFSVWREAVFAVPFLEFVLQDSVAVFRLEGLR